jgi:hypothetical protein
MGCPATVGTVIPAAILAVLCLALIVWTLVLLNRSRLCGPQAPAKEGLDGAGADT